MRTFHRRETGYELEVELRLRWLEFFELPQASRDHINSTRLVSVEETAYLLDEVFAGRLIMKED